MREAKRSPSKKGLFMRLALTNMKAQRRIYVPYLLSCICCIAMFYMMCFLERNSGLSEMRGGEQLRMVLALGCIVIAIFSIVIVLYANSFLMKQRKKELGLYNILGMGKRHIGLIMATETLMSAAASIIGGIGLGILFSKLMELLLYELLQAPQAPMGFEVQPLAVGLTLLLFAGIFFIALVWNVSRVHVANPIELLRGSNVGEKEPKAKWAIAILGVLTLGAGYALAITIKDPSMAAVVFFLAVILVIIGTYCLFTSGSIAVLKALRKNKSYYYRTKHFTSVSGMLYRMKQNAVGLGNICVLSTMVLVMLSTTICLYSGLEDTIRETHPRDVQVEAFNLSDERFIKMLRDLDETVEQSGLTVSNRAVFRYESKHFTYEDGALKETDGSYTGGVTCYTYFIPQNDYDALFNTNLALAPGEVFIHAGEVDVAGDTLAVSGLEYKIKGRSDEFPRILDNNLTNSAQLFVIVPDADDIEAILHPAAIPEGEEDPYDGFYGYSMSYGIDVAEEAEQPALVDALRESVIKVFEEEGVEEYGHGYAQCAYDAKSGFLGLYGGLFFLGVFLSLMFMCAATLIMYYKQISEGYDDRGRFEIMQNVGMSRQEVRSSIRSQVLTVFFLPLVVAGIHTASAFPLIGTMFVIFQMTNTALFAACTVACFFAFALLYAGVYALTARTYYKIVAE